MGLSAISKGAALIEAERLRQITEEGYTPEHDDACSDAELADAAVAYVYAADPTQRGEVSDFWPWPWSMERWKPDPDNVRNLVKAGALIAAAIDRLLRAREKGEAAHG